MAITTKPTKNTPTPEIFTWLLSLSTLLYLHSHLLFTDQRTLSHDTFYAYYPLYSYFAEYVSQGILPLWNPYPHGGEPFYPLMLFLRFLDPFSLILTPLGMFLTGSPSLIFNWIYFIQIQFMILGAYLFLRRWTQTFPQRAFLILTLSLSTFTLGPLRQIALLGQFQWTPWVLILARRIFWDNNRTWKQWILFAGLLCISTHAYWFVGTWLSLILAFFVALCYRGRAFFKPTFKMNQHRQWLFLIVAIAIGFAPNFILWKESSDWTVPLRLVPKGYKSTTPKGAAELFSQPMESAISPKLLDYSALSYSGTFSTPDDFLQLLVGDGNKQINAKTETWGSPSEGYLYMGVLTYLLALIAVIYAPSVWPLSLSLLATALILLGPPFFLHRILFWFMPPLWFVRHTSHLALLFSFQLLGLALIGLRQLNKSRNKKRDPIFFLAIALHLFLLFIYATPRTHLISLLLSTLIFPVLLILFTQKLPLPHALKSSLISFLLLAWLVVDFAHQWDLATILRRGMTLPRHVNSRIEDIPTRTLFPKVFYATEEFGLVPEQEPRYGETLFRQFTVFSNLRRKTPQNPDSFTQLNQESIWATLFEMNEFRSLSQSNLSGTEKDRLFGVNAPVFTTESEHGNSGIQVREFSPNQVSLQTATGGRKLIWNNSFDPHWSAVLDGTPATLESLLPRGMAVTLPKGNHLVTFQYRPWPILIALFLHTALYATTLAVYLLLVVKNTKSTFFSLGRLRKTYA